MNKRFASLSVGFAVVLSLMVAWVLGQSIAASFQSTSIAPIPVLQKTANSRNLNGEDSFLFGKPDLGIPAAAKPREITDQVTKTKLNLKLIGMIDLGDQGVAIIQSGAKTLVVKHNESILPNVILLDVFADGILIDNQGQQERLLYDQTVSNLVSKVKSKSVPAEPTVSGRLSLQEQQNLNNIGEQLRKEPMSISKYIRFQPLNENGQWVGVKLWSNTDANLYKSLGFGEGDILRQVNGHSIEDMAKDPRLWQTFLSADQFDLVVDRDGAPQMINVNFR